MMLVWQYIPYWYNVSTCNNIVQCGLELFHSRIGAMYKVGKVTRGTHQGTYKQFIDDFKREEWSNIPPTFESTSHKAKNHRRTCIENWDGCTSSTLCGGESAARSTSQHYCSLYCATMALLLTHGQERPARTNDVLNKTSPFNNKIMPVIMSA